MKLFKKITITALAATGAFVFAGCAAAANVSATSSNWYVRTGHTGIQPTSVEGSEGFAKEILTYGVSLAENSASNEYYSVKIDPTASTYRTEFYATTFDWNTQTKETYKADKTETVYVLKTELQVTGYYTLLNTTAGAEHFTDSVVTESYFRSAGENLTPLYSFQQVNSTSPATPKPGSAAEMVERYSYTYAVYYNADATEATVVYANAGAEPAESTVNLGKIKSSLFDNAYLYFAVRAMGINEVGYSKTVNAFIPADGGAKEYTVTTTAKQKLGEDQTAIKNALVGAGYIAESDEIQYNSVSVASTENLAGGTQSVWYAAIGDASFNACRSTMLKLTVPLSYNLGTMEYNLKSVESVLGSAD